MSSFRRSNVLETQKGLFGRPFFAIFANRLLSIPSITPFLHARLPILSPISWHLGPRRCCGCRVPSAGQAVADDAPGDSRFRCPLAMAASAVVTLKLISQSA